MSQVIRHPEGKHRPHSAPRQVRVRRVWSRSAAAVRRVLRLMRVHSVARRQVPSPRRWGRRWTPAMYVRLFAVIGTLVFVGWLGMALWVVITGSPGPVERRCGRTGASCSAVIGFVTPFLVLALSIFVFLAVRYYRVYHPIHRTARQRPRDLVPTAGTIIEEVVGRQELCAVLAQALRDRRTRRPYVLVGSVGSGKTAVLVQLTQLLAEKGAVPVPVHLRGVDLDGAELNFAELARQRFCDEVDPGVVSRAQAERVWRQLCMDDRVVVLADGLEEAFCDGDRQRDRDSLIRRAVRRADRQHLPLVVASRPHAALEGTPAAMIDLEPLSEEAALTFLERQEPDVDGRRLDWIVETAGVSESPLYLQIARQLRRHQLLEHFENTKEWDQIDTRGSDRAGIRLSLLESWRKALVEGHLQAQFALPRRRRESAVDVISALACIGLLRDRMEVRFDELLAGRDEHGHRCTEIRQPEIWAALRARVADLPRTEDEGCWRAALSLYAAHGEQLGLVEAYGHKVRFPHSILQAYLGSRFLGAVQMRAPDDPLSTALEEPGRELLMALILRSRLRDRTPRRPVVERLLRAADGRQDAKALDLYAAALEIDSVTVDDSCHQRIADTLCDRWTDITTGDQRTLDEAKTRTVHRFGEALRRLDRPERNAACRPRVKPAYERLIRICCQEPAYPVRLAIAQEIGAGGDAAFDAIRKFFPWPSSRGDPAALRYDPVVQYRLGLEELHYRAKAEREQRIAPRPRPAAVAAGVGASPDGPTPAPAAAGNPGPGRAAAAVVAGNGRGSRNGGSDDDESGVAPLWRQFVLRAWLVPMILGSVGDDRRSQARERLDLWLAHLQPDGANGRADLPLSLEIALAQGFKSAANRRRRHPAASVEAREYLVERAEVMLTHARFWYSQLTLIHALCLWELPDATDGGLEHREHADRTPVDPLHAVERWLTMAGSERAPGDRRADESTRRGVPRLHPFVAEAGDLAALALESGHPERFVWIDEKGAMANIGSSPADPGVYRKHNLWIPPSVGWSTLHPRAQQLLADVLLLLNLTERSGSVEDLEARLERTNRATLPPCLAKDRRPLQPERTVGMPGAAEPGSTCLRDCPFELCPYPPKGELPRAELREPFCRQQRALVAVHSLHRRKALWQGMTDRELAGFWTAMAARTRTPDR